MVHPENLLVFNHLLMASHARLERRPSGSVRFDVWVPTRPAAAFLSAGTIPCRSGAGPNSATRRARLYRIWAARGQKVRSLVSLPCAGFADTWEWSHLA